MHTSAATFTQTIAPPDPAQQRLPAWREDLVLQEAPQGLDGAPHWNLYDPARNRFFRIGWLEFTLLSHWRAGITPVQLCALVQQNSPLQPQSEDVLILLQFLERNELLRSSSIALRTRLQQLATSRQHTLWQWLLHHYLFVRIPLFQPEAFLRATQSVYERVCRPGILMMIGLAALLTGRRRNM